MSETQARAMVEQAKQQLGSWSFVWSSSNNLESAAELYIKAGNNFQLVSLCKTGTMHLSVIPVLACINPQSHL